IAATLARGPRLVLARADSAGAAANLAIARQFENPGVAIQHTESTPTEHYALDVPLDLPWLRGPRVEAANAALTAAIGRFAFERANIAYTADTTYTHALAARERAKLSARSAHDADSLLTLARLRREAGDASELDVQLAIVAAGQLANAAAVDSLEATSALLGVQALMGLPTRRATIALTDTLAPPAVIAAATDGTPLLVAAAEADARSAELALVLERRRWLPGISLSAGWESGDPGGTGSKLLPSFGLAFPIPLFNRNGPAILAASAQRDRAAALLAVTRLEQDAALARAERTLNVARERQARSARLLSGAVRVAELSLLAYREGAAALPSVLEAQRTARDAQAQYLDDVAALRNAAGLVQLLTLTTPTRTAP
ncbi:MAG: TolC family protein, partial [Gemmatimonadetes bacterium]|nr:TolC family protein [Gemmatimonadota bacterium]